MSLDFGIFLASAMVALFGATMMISQRNPVASVLYLIVSLVAQAVVYVQLGAMFLGAILIVVYAGAILVLFLFVIMLLNLRSTADLGAPSPPLSVFTRIAVPLLLIMELYFVVKEIMWPGVPTGMMGSPSAETFGSVKTVATLMFTDYLYPFQLTGLLLLIAVVGAVVVARRERGDETPHPSDARTTTAHTDSVDRVVK
jgi:NADH-quinone oxidoreductase subunit J